MRRWLGVFGLVLVGLMTWACQNETPPTLPSIIITNNNVNNNGQGSAPGTSVPGDPAAVAAVHLGCDQMTGPGGEALQGCGPALEDYEAEAGSHGRLDATPVDSQGAKVEGQSVQGWSVVGACDLDGDTFGPDGFNPTIHMDLGECVVSVSVAGHTASRKFIGQ